LDDEIRRLNLTEKLAFLLTEYALKEEIGINDRERIKSLSNIRNCLVHFGHFPKRGSVYRDAVLFIRLTEFIIAKTLGMAPPNVFNTMEELEDFLKRRPESKRGKP
jgi:hypothetical protein